MNHGFDLTTTDPEQFQEQISPLVGAPRVRPARGSRFDISVRAARLNTLSTFTVRSPTLRVDLAPPHSFFCLNIPLGSPFSVTENRRVHRFSDDIHLLRPERHFHLDADKECRMLVVCLDHDQVNKYAFRLSGSRNPFQPAEDVRMPLASPALHALVRGLAGLWSELRRLDASPASSLQLAEREDALMSCFVESLSVGDADSGPAGQPDPAVIARSEDYLCARLTQPVSRAELAAAAGVSIRSLSRAFSRRWGTGPMGFLKARRLDAAYRELLGTAPGETTVTEVAYRYGFTHLGKFAGEYRRAFRESPSETLRH